MLETHYEKVPITLRIPSATKMKTKSLASLLPRPSPGRLPDVFKVHSPRSQVLTHSHAPEIHPNSLQSTNFPKLRAHLLPSIPAEKPRANVLRWQMQHVAEVEALAKHAPSSSDQSLVLPKLKPHTLRLKAVSRTERDHGAPSARSPFPF